MDDAPASIGKYVLFFTGAYTAILIVVTVILQFTDANGTSMSFAALFGGIAFAGDKFARDRNRAPTPQERLGFAIGSTLSSIAVSAVLTGLGLLLLAGPHEVAALTELLTSSPLPVIFGIVFLTAIDFTALYFAFRWFTNMTVKNIERRKARNAAG